MSHSGFKPGQKIRRTAHVTIGSEYIRKGGIYIVEADAEFNSIILRGIPGSWVPEYFELVKSKDDKEFENLWV